MIRQLHIAKKILKGGIAIGALKISVSHVFVSKLVRSSSPHQGLFDSWVL